MASFLRRIGVKPVDATPRFDTHGHWTLTVSAPGVGPVDILVFRGAPTQIASFDFEDPFGPSTLSFSLPAVSIFDALGQGDLAWLVKEADVDLAYTGPLPAGYPVSGFRWEGYVGTWDWSDNGLSVSCVGAMHQLDLEKAKPGYPAQPLPYEVAISRCFAGRPYLRTRALRIEWPVWWKTFFATPAKGTPSYLIPTGVTPGSKWTALLTRSTGNWDDMLTGYVQSLLTSMYTERGRWTIDLDPGRSPVMRHRDIRTEISDFDVVIDAAQPGVKISLSEDWTQSLNVAYGQGSSLAGVSYTGMEVSSDGLVTSYRPLAAARQVEPASDKNGWFQRSRFRREVSLQLQPGLTEIEARKVAAQHLQRFGDPGVVGTITLQTDPKLGGQPMPRHLILPGMTCRLPKVFGSPDGPLLAITKVSYDFTSQTQTLTVDSKYRDQLTVEEVRKRGRDALAVTRMLVAGSYQPPVSDSLLPWDYSLGSGCIPGAAQASSVRLFKGMPSSVRFPWTEWTTQRPPKSTAWRNCYIRLGPASDDANRNWSAASDKAGSRLGIPIRMSQAGQIRLLQLAAYDRDGNVLPVSFHFSLYYSRGVNYMSTPQLPTALAPKFPPYKGGQHYPFFPNAWEQYNDDGTQANPNTASAVQSAGLIRAWGSAYEKAGHWPGSSAAGDPATGLLVDEAGFDFDTTHFDANFDPYSPSKNKTNPLAGQVYAMIWCDAQKSQEVFFAGRMFRTEPGA